MAVLVATLMLLAGCGAGQLSREYLRLAGNGAEGQVGDIAIRGAMLPYDHPIVGGAVYRRGEAVGVRATFVNEGGTTDRLVSVSSPIAGGGSVLGDATIPGHHTLAAGYTDPVASVALPDTKPIELRLTDLNTEVRAGPTYPVVFTFAHAGRVRVELRVANPETLPKECPLPPNGKPPKTLTAPTGRAPTPPAPPPPECSSLLSEPAQEVLDVGDPLVHPTWATEHNALLGFVEEGRRRLVRVDPKTGETVRSRATEGAGENFGLIAHPHERVVVPLTDSSRVVLLDSRSLTETDGLGTDPAPSRVAVQELSKSLLTLSEDGSTVTGTNYETGEVLLRHEVRAGPQAVMESDSALAGPSYWLVGPGGLSYFSAERGPRPVATLGAALSHDTFTPEDGSARSAYLAEESSSRVKLLEAVPRGELAVAAETDLGATVEHLEASPEEERVYAVTSDRVFTLKFDTLEVTKTTEFRGTLEKAGLGDARVSDFTVGDDFLYLALEGEPHVLKVGK